MNISSDNLEAAKGRDGAPAEDRPQYVDESLHYRKRVGWHDGLPVVEPSGDYETPKLGEPVAPLYDHYKRGESLLLPEAGSFLSRLFDAEEIQRVEDAADELQADVETVRKAAELHGLEPPTESSDNEGDSGRKKLRLPSGETVPLTLLNDPPHEDKLVLAQLLSEGMGVGEIANYLSREGDERVTEADVTEAAQSHGLLSGGGDSSDLRDPIPRAERTTTGGEPEKTPW